MNELSPPQEHVLVVLRQSGPCDARRVDIEVSVRLGGGARTALEELRELERLGLVMHVDSHGVGGRWALATGADEAGEK